MILPGFFLIGFALWIFCVFDVITSDEVVMRNLPKMGWLFVVIIAPMVGSIAWLVLGRPQATPRLQGGAVLPRFQTRPRPARGPAGPEDRPGFAADLDQRAKDLARWEAELRRREEGLREQGDESS